MTDLSSAELFEFPCDHMFKAFGPNDGEFAAAVRTAVSQVTPVALDAMKLKLSTGGALQCVSVLILVHNYTQVQNIYSELKQVPRLKYLL
jgi:putative lipoic acid-binding regulatory protein